MLRLFFQIGVRSFVLSAVGITAFYLWYSLPPLAKWPILFGILRRPAKAAFFFGALRIALT